MQNGFFGRVQFSLLAFLMTLFDNAANATTLTQALTAFRPPAIPLVVHDPYFSIWSTTDKLTDDWAKHWTGRNHAMGGLVRIDDKPYRIIGRHPENVPALEQTGRVVLPTRTIYTFSGGGIELTLTFMTPALPEDLEVLSRPVTYISWDVRSMDAKPHMVSVYFDCTLEATVNETYQEVLWTRSQAGPLTLMRAGTLDQPVLAKRGDDLRIDWGYLYLAYANDGNYQGYMGSSRPPREEFSRSGKLPTADDVRMPRAASDEWPALVCATQAARVEGESVRGHVMLAYDDLWSIEYLQRRLRPYWRRDGMDAPELLMTAAADYEKLEQRCAALDEKVLAEATAAGGEKYAALASLAFRQCLGAHKLAADFDGTPLHFSKENFSNGCIATVDVTYPASPFFLHFNPELLEAQIRPILEYARSSRWKFPFAPHDIGTYPLANGQVYGGGERTEQDQMPVEECGNMLIMAAALAREYGNVDFAQPFWGELKQWADYLREKGLDPENQLCTDDFAGHLAHNTNLSLKAILGIGCYATLCQLAAKQDEAVDYRKAAEEMAAAWVQNAADGDHYRLTFDRPNTWSQKYNLLWDKALGLNLFPEQVAQREIAYYLKQQNAYGLPLDSRKAYTKLDWIAWTACLAETDEARRQLLEPLYRFAHETPQRVPLSDWYETVDATRVGFTARSVVGGVFVPVYVDAQTLP